MDAPTMEDVASAAESGLGIYYDCTASLCCHLSSVSPEGAALLENVASGISAVFTWALGATASVQAVTEARCAGMQHAIDILEDHKAQLTAMCRDLRCQPTSPRRFAAAYCMKTSVEGGASQRVNGTIHALDNTFKVYPVFLPRILQSELPTCAT